MSFIKTIAVAALAFGVVGSASAAENQFVAPTTVKAIVSGEIIETLSQMPEDGTRQMLRNYLIGFGSGMHAECGVLPSSIENDLLSYVKKVMRDGDRAALVLKAGYEDAKLLTGAYGCGSDVGRAATRTVQRYMK
ncbi:MAG: hypothetical protein KIT36_08515 [Alphaproteobacteria bacterium]|nr:hypothetical protein [Alphaproteobacteria bacterium]